MFLFFLLHVNGNSDCLYHVFAGSSFQDQILRAWKGKLHIDLFQIYIVKHHRHCHQPRQCLSGAASAELLV
ncbi:hypothetical protein MUK42_18184 [Musa troglodytarum]|uniref:Uncharacterized protein n=1 Tax=Musa troglodytarum TaxID=320322 RepID=A0A9E7L6S8_9LILI|nr:hypothetical protein MUK42_18184 [Musa troglodytarum]